MATIKLHNTDNNRAIFYYISKLQMYIIFELSYKYEISGNIY